LKNVLAFFLKIRFNVVNFNIGMDLSETGWKGVEWIYLTQDRNQWQELVDMVMKFWVP
jgi:hypothetical protein